MGMSLTSKQLAISAIDDGRVPEEVLSELVRNFGTQTTKAPSHACIRREFIGGVEAVDLEAFAMDVVQDYDYALSIAQAMLDGTWTDSDQGAYTERYTVLHRDELISQLKDAAQIAP